jgi:hypothetical protein
MVRGYPDPREDFASLPIITFIICQKASQWTVIRIVYHEDHTVPRPSPIPSIAIMRIRMQWYPPWRSRDHDSPPIGEAQDNHWIPLHWNQAARHHDIGNGGLARNRLCKGRKVRYGW